MYGIANKSRRKVTRFDALIFPETYLWSDGRVLLTHAIYYDLKTLAKSEFSGYNISYGDVPAFDRVRISL